METLEKSYFLLHNSFLRMHSALEFIDNLDFESTKNVVLFETMKEYMNHVCGFEEIISIHTELSYYYGDKFKKLVEMAQISLFFFIFTTERDIPDKDAVFLNWKENNLPKLKEYRDNLEEIGTLLNDLRSEIHSC